MTGECFINNVDIWTTYGCSLSEGSYENLLLPASPKELTENKSPNNNGKDIIMPVSRKVDERDIQVTFDVSGTSRANYISNLNGLLSALSGAVALKVISLSTVYNLTVKSYVSLSASVGLTSCLLVVRFNEPNPANRTAL